MGFAEILALSDVTVRDVLGRSLTWTTGAGAPSEVVGVFDAAYVRVDLGPAGVSSPGPAVFFPVLADLATDPEEDPTATVTVSGVVYSFYEVQKDGQGAVRLFLHRNV